MFTRLMVSFPTKEDLRLFRMSWATSLEAEFNHDSAEKGSILESIMVLKVI